jgi:site-specific recombinase XerD
VAALTAYLQQGRPHLSTAHAAIDPQAVFLSRAGTRLCSVLVAQAVRTRARRAHLPGRVTTHTLRHSAAVHLLAGGANVREVQEFLGHADLETTAHYTRLVLTDLKRALERCHPRRRMRA